MRKFFYLFAFIILLISVGLYTSFTGFFEDNQCQATWMSNAGHKNWYHDKTKSCRMSDEAIPTGYHQIKNRWYYVIDKNYWTECGFFKRCDKRAIDYYLLSEDVEGFSILNSDYAKDKIHVFYKQDRIIDAQAASFSLLGDGQSNYSTDAQSVFYKENLIPQAKPQSFHILGERTESVYNNYGTYAADDTHIYIDGEFIQGAHASSFRLFKIDELPPTLNYTNHLGYDDKHLYYRTTQQAQELDMQNFKHIGGHLFTDGRIVFSLKSYELVSFGDVMQAPVQMLTNYIAIDQQQRVFINNNLGDPVYHPEVDARNLKILLPTCPQEVYPHLKLSCDAPLELDRNIIYFENDTHVYYMRTSSSERDFSVYDFETVFEKNGREHTTYLFPWKNSEILLHGQNLYTHGELFTHERKYINELHRFASVKLEGDLYGPIRSDLFADNGGFIITNLLSENSNDEVWELGRYDEAKTYGALRLYEKQPSQTNYVFENDYFIYVYWPLKPGRTSTHIRKKDLQVTELSDNGRAELPAEKAAEVLEMLGLELGLEPKSIQPSE